MVEGDRGPHINRSVEAEAMLVFGSCLLPDVAELHPDEHRALAVTFGPHDHACLRAEKFCSHVQLEKCSAIVAPKEAATNS